MYAQFRNQHRMDEITARVELEEGAFAGELKDLASVRKHVGNELKAVLNIRTNVDLVEKGAIPRTAGKAHKIVDMRNAL